MESSRCDRIFTELLTSLASAIPAPLTSRLGVFLRASVRHTEGAAARARKEPTGSAPKPAHVGQPRTTVVNPACGSSLDRNEEQDSGLRRSLVERDKEEDGVVGLGLKETHDPSASSPLGRWSLVLGPFAPWRR
jgi:hypothetical protein